MSAPGTEKARLSREKHWGLCPLCPNIYCCLNSHSQDSSVCIGFQWSAEKVVSFFLWRLFRSLNLTLRIFLFVGVCLSLGWRFSPKSCGEVTRLCSGHLSRALSVGSAHPHADPGFLAHAAQVHVPAVILRRAAVQSSGERIFLVPRQREGCSGGWPGSPCVIPPFRDIYLVWAQHCARSRRWQGTRRARSQTLRNLHAIGARQWTSKQTTMTSQAGKGPEKTKRPSWERQSVLAARSTFPHTEDSRCLPDSSVWSAVLPTRV